MLRPRPSLASWCCFHVTPPYVVAARTATSTSFFMREVYRCVRPPATLIVCSDGRRTEGAHDAAPDESSNRSALSRHGREICEGHPSRRGCVHRSARRAAWSRTLRTDTDRDEDWNAGGGDRRSLARLQRTLAAGRVPISRRDVAGRVVEVPRGQRAARRPG